MSSSSSYSGVELGSQDAWLTPWGLEQLTWLPEFWARPNQAGFVILPCTTSRYARSSQILKASTLAFYPLVSLGCPSTEPGNMCSDHISLGNSLKLRAEVCRHRDSLQLFN
uniref:Uncharacterized protein n=1 Tax=Knipowitschia caucasica TaxID=637954 RepID=A0AAV2IUA1_KNICA